MKTIIRYELKKIFQNKLFIGAFVICLVAMIALSSIAVYQYNAGTRGHFDMTLMKGEKAPEVFVSNDTIDELRKAVQNFQYGYFMYSISTTLYIDLSSDASRKAWCNSKLSSFHTKK